MTDRYGTLRQGLVGAWCPSLRTGGYTLEDRSNVRYNGTLVNAPAWSAGALSLTASSQQYVAVWNPAAVNRYTGGALGVTAWIRPTSVATTSVIASTLEEGGSPATFQLEIGRTSGRVGWYQGNNIRQSSASISANQWSLIGGTRWFDGSTWQIRLWINGVLESFTDTFPSPTSTTGILAIGRPGSFNSVHYDGLIDDVRIWNRPLTAAEFRLLQTGRGVGLVPTRHRRANVLGSQFWLRQSGTWKKATGWIKVNGVWTKATPKLNVTGTWK